MEKNDLQGGMGGRATTQGFQEVFLENFFTFCEAPFLPQPPPEFHHLEFPPVDESMNRPTICYLCGLQLTPDTGYNLSCAHGFSGCAAFHCALQAIDREQQECALLLAGLHECEELAVLTASFATTAACPSFHGGPSAGLLFVGDRQAMTIALQFLGASGRRLLLLGYSADYACLHLQVEPGQPGDSPVGQAEISSVMQYWTALAHPPGVAPPLALGGRARALAARHANFTLPLPPGGNGPPGSAPGDWTCRNCGNINFAFREKCNRCNMPRPGAKLYGPMAAAERRICPYTVMLVRVPSHVSEPQVPFCPLASRPSKLQLPYPRRLCAPTAGLTCRSFASRLQRRSWCSARSPPAASSFSGRGLRSSGAAASRPRAHLCTPSAASCGRPRPRRRSSKVRSSAWAGSSRSTPPSRAALFQRR